MTPSLIRDVICLDLAGCGLGEEISNFRLLVDGTQELGAHSDKGIIKEVPIIPCFSEVLIMGVPEVLEWAFDFKDENRVSFNGLN